MAAKKPAAKTTAVKKPAAKKPAAKKPDATKPAAKKPAAKKAVLKTQFTGASVDAFLGQVESDQRRSDAREVIALMTKVTGSPARMLGPSIIAFGNAVLTYPNGRTLDWCEVAFSPRKAALVFYVYGSEDARKAFLPKLGKHKTDKGCIYVNKLDDVDRGVLEGLIRASVESVRRRQAT